MENFVITSKTNPQIKDLASLLKYKKTRDKHGLFVLEGAKLVFDALPTDIKITKVYITQSAANKHRELTYMLNNNDIKQVYISEEVAAWATEAKNSQGVFAIVKTPEAVEGISINEKGKYIILDRIQDPGNVGAILRTALALGIDGVFMAQNSVELYSPKVLRGSMGAVLKLAVEQTADTVDYIERLKDYGIRVYATALTGDSISVNEADLSPGVAVVLGNEGAGLEEGIVDNCDKSIIIPMTGEAQSLNVATAATIVMWELTKN